MDSSETYRRLAPFYDLYVAGFDADIALYRELCAPGHSVLEIGCGTGRVLSPLVARGCSVTGADISEEMLGLARSKLARQISEGAVTLLRHDFAVAALDQRFDRILVTYYTFNYLLQRDAQDRFLRNAAASLAPGGLLVLDLFFPRALEPNKKSDRWRESTLAQRDRRVALQQKKRMRGDIEERIQVFTDGGTKETIVTRRKYVSKQQMRELLHSAGLRRVQVADGYELGRLHTVTESEPTQRSFVCVGSVG